MPQRKHKLPKDEPKVENLQYFIGIDIGLHGAVVIIESGSLTPPHVKEVFLTPLIGDKFDFKTFYAKLCKYQRLNGCAVFEDLHALFKSSAKSTFNFGGVNYATEMLCVALEIPYTKVQAKKWQGVMFEGIPKVFKEGKKLDTKAMALIAAKRLFPTVKLTDPDSKRAKVPHNGIVDALLIAEYARRTFK
jgi:hypothetical protein